MLIERCIEIAWDWQRCKSSDKDNRRAWNAYCLSMEMMLSQNIVCRKCLCVCALPLACMCLAKRRVKLESNRMDYSLLIHQHFSTCAPWSMIQSFCLLWQYFFYACFFLSLFPSVHFFLPNFLQIDVNISLWNAQITSTPFAFCVICLFFTSRRSIFRENRFCALNKQVDWMTFRFFTYLNKWQIVAVLWKIFRHVDNITKWIGLVGMC